MSHDGALSDGVIEKIAIFVEREAGEELPLSAADEAMVRDLLAHDPAAQAIAYEFRATSAALDAAFAVYAEQPVSPELLDLIDAHAAFKKGGGTEPDQPADTVVAFPHQQTTTSRSYASYFAIAASILSIALGGSLAYHYSRLDQTRMQLANVSADLERSASALDEEEAKSGELGQALAELRETGEQLKRERAALETSVTALTADKAELGEQVETNSRTIADLESALAASRKASADAERRIAETSADLQKQLAFLVEERDQYADQAENRRQEIAALENDLEAARQARTQAETSSTSASEEIAALHGKEADLLQQVAALKAAQEEQQARFAELSGLSREAAAKGSSERQALSSEIARLEDELAMTSDARAAVEADLKTARNRLSTLEGDLAAREQTIAELENEAAQATGDLNVARAKLADVNRANDLLLAEADDLRQRTDWVVQVLGYHRLYAGTAHEVEVSTEKELTGWLEKTFGRRFSVPDLSDLDMTFVGGRIFAVNGRPVGQIAYHDLQGKLTGFCFTPKEAGGQDAMRAGQNGDLSAINWQKGDLDYVLVGFADLKTVLVPVAARLYTNYGVEL